MKFILTDIFNYFEQYLNSKDNYKDPDFNINRRDINLFFHKGFWSGLIFLSFLLVISPSLYAQQGPYKLEEIVVTASRVATPILEASANITVIAREDIEESGATNIVDVLKKEPGVFTANLLNNPKTAQIDIRGFGETGPSNTLFLIDGRRVNNIDLAGADLSQIPIDAIERIEIYRGPVTVLFGDNATGGVVNIILKKGEGRPKAQGSILSGSYGLFLPKMSVSGKEKSFSYYALASYFNTDGYRHNNHLRTKDLFGNLTFDATKKVSLYLQTGFHKDSYGLPGALSLTELKTGIYDRKDSKKPNDSADTEDNFVNLGADIKPNDDIVFSLNGSYRIRHNSAAYPSWYTMRSMKTYGFMPKITITKPVWDFKNTLVAGFDYYVYPTRATDFDPVWFTDSVTKIKRTDYAFYVNNEFYLLKNLLMSAGYRVQKSFWDIDYVDNFGFLPSIDSTVNDKKDAFRLSANYIIERKGEKKGNIFITYAKGFRMAATDELFNVWAFPPVNRELKTQVVKEIDLGARYNFTNWIGGSLTLFQSKTDNELYYDPYTFTNGNYDKTKREGLEAGIYLNPLKNLNLTILYSYIDARFDGGDYDKNKIPFVPKDKFSFKTTYIWNNLTSNITATYVGRRYLISDQKNELPQLPGFMLIDLDFKYRLGKLDGLLGVKNLTGKKYSEYGVAGGWPRQANFYPSPERQFYFGLSYNY